MIGVLIPLPVRRVVLARDAGRCGFCRSAEALMGVTFELDHVMPHAAGGKTEPENLCLCCPTCNRHKAARTRVVDPETKKRVPLFHPVRWRWEEHFAWRAGATVIAGRSAAGRATAEALRMNRPMMVELRRYWAATGYWPALT